MSNAHYDLWKKYFGENDEHGAYETQEDHQPLDYGHYAAPYQPHPYYDGGERVVDETNVRVDNETDIDVVNDVKVAQTVDVSIELGDGAGAVIGGGLNLAPTQNVAVGNVDGDVKTGDVAVEAGDSVGDGLGWGPGWGFGWGGRDLASNTNIEINNNTDIDITNNVTAVQNTVIDIDVGPGAFLALGDALGAGPAQNVDAGNFDAGVDTGAPVAIDADDALA